MAVSACYLVTYVLNIEHRAPLRDEQDCAYEFEVMCGTRVYGEQLAPQCNSPRVCCTPVKCIAICDFNSCIALSLSPVSCMVGLLHVQVSVRILGGLMALGYEIGTIMKRATKVYTDDNVTIKFDDIEGMPDQYIQVGHPQKNSYVLERFCASEQN
jgi:hypothetical protein